MQFFLEMNYSKLPVGIKNNNREKLVCAQVDKMSRTFEFTLRLAAGF